MTCVINLPTHFSNWQGSVFQPKTITVRYNDKAWFTSEIRKEIRIRDRLRKEIRIFLNMQKNRETWLII
jgi:hypothetical protein